MAAALGTTIKYTGAYSPYINGSMEHNHAVVDKIIVKLKLNHHKIDLPEAVDTACLAKNSKINYMGYSPHTNP